MANVLSEHCTSALLWDRYQSPTIQWMPTTVLPKCVSIVYEIIWRKQDRSLRTFKSKQLRLVLKWVLGMKSGERDVRWFRLKNAQKSLSGFSFLANRKIRYLVLSSLMSIFSAKALWQACGWQHSLVFSILDYSQLTTFVTRLVKEYWTVFSTQYDGPDNQRVV